MSRWRDILSFSRHLLHSALPIALLGTGGCYSQNAVDEVWHEHGFMMDTGMGVLDTHRVNFDEPLTDADFRRVCPSLQKLNVEVLDLSNAHGVGDASIPFIRQVASLREVMLQGTKITPDGVQKLKGMPNLKWVSVGKRAEFTHTEVERLRHDLGGITVKWFDNSLAAPEVR